VKPGAFRKGLCAAAIALGRIPGLSRIGREGARLLAGSYKDRRFLGGLTGRPWISPRSQYLVRGEVRFGHDVFISDGCVVHAPEPDSVLAFGDRTTLWDGCLLQIGPGGRLAIGADCHLQPGCVITAFGRVEIGDQVQMAPRCALYPYSHDWSDGTRPIREQPIRSKGGIVIESDVWLGYGVVVLDGVRIGKGAVVGAGSVVTRDIPPGRVAAGVPARVIGSRGTTEPGPWT
jgi:acetyltransferase-like isoleucine patch superfamily enzyme